MTGVTTLLAATLAATNPQSVPTFASAAEVVVLDVSVSDGHAPVRGLHAQDFVVLDNGVPQRVDLVAGEDLPVHAFLLLDVSSSVEGEPLARLRQSARAFLASLEPADSLTLIVFSEQILLAHSADSSDRGRVEGLIADLPCGGGTALHDAIFTALSLTRVEGRRSFVLLLSDGWNTAGWLEAAQVLDVAREASAVVSVVTTPDTMQATAAGSSAVLRELALGRNADVQSRAAWEELVSPAALLNVTRTKAHAFLRTLAADTGGDVVSTERRDLAAAFRRALSEYRSRYRLRYEPVGMAREGWHALTVRLARRKGTVKARNGYARR